MVLYLETESGDKYELNKSMSLCYYNAKIELEMDVFDVIRFAKVKHPKLIDNEYLNEVCCPLKEDQVEILYPNLDWNEIQWGNTSILIKGEKRIEGLKSFKFYKRDKDAK